MEYTHSDICNRGSFWRVPQELVLYVYQFSVITVIWKRDEQ